MDRLQLVGEIKHRFPDLAVMMVTAYGDDKQRRRGVWCSRLSCQAGRRSGGARLQAPGDHGHALVDSEVYPDALTARGLAYMRPTPEERDEINRIIMGELVCGVLIRPISEDIAATPHRLDVIASASCPREFIAQRAD